jgi:colanic acid/amylovoran biosynthesis protein
MIPKTMRRAARSFRSHPIARAVPWTIDRFATRLSRRNPPNGTVVVVVATGHGNIGDQAMLDAIIHRLSDHALVLVAEDEGAVSSPGNGNSIEVIPGLLNGAAFSRFKAHRKFAALARSADEVVVIGADLMDGLYNPRKSVARMSLLHTAVAVGGRARVTGFSWPTAPSRAVAGIARGLSRDVVFCLRDPESFTRFTSEGKASARLTADVVFSDRRHEPLPRSIQTWVEANEAQGRPFAVVNISGLIEKRIPQLEEYGAIFDSLRRRGYSIAVLPHVVREDDGDSAIARELFSRLGQTQDILILQLLSPSQVRQLVRNAAVVVTGRMHLAIMSLSQETPALTLATQGKVEGLYSMFGLEDLAIEPTAGFGDRIAASLEAALGPEARQRISESLPRVRSRAEENFEGFA